MKDIIRKVLTEVLDTMYQQFWPSVILTILIMFFVMYAGEKGWKQIVKKWIENFKTNQDFRKQTILIFYVTMILFRTVLNRNVWRAPLSNVLGTWWFYYEDGTVSTEAAQNLVLFIPFIFLLFWALCKEIFKGKVTFCRVLGKAFIVSLCFTLSIEFAQLFLRLGTFQLSDIFYNTLGGLIGGLIYWLAYKISHRRN